MTEHKKNIFLTGAPSIGKTTVIKKLIKLLHQKATGFYTEEERIDSRRVGFMMHTLDGKSGYLAHETIESDFHIRRYGVSIENIKTIAIPAIAPLPDHIIILDEIGKMECFCPEFITAALRALDSPNTVIGTITLGGGEVIQQIKARPDVVIYEVTLENREMLAQTLVQEIVGF